MTPSGNNILIYFLFLPLKFQCRTDDQIGGHQETSPVGNERV